MELERPKWAYAVGTIGAGVFGLGALLILVQLTATKPSATTVPLWLLASGGGALGVCWIATFKQGHAGFGAIGGSFLVPIALAYINSHRNEWGALKAHGTLLLLSFTAFAAGHCFVRCLLWARWIAGTAALVFAFQLVAIGAKWHLGAAARNLALLSFGALTALGVALAIAIPRLFTQPIVGHQQPHDGHL